MSIIEQLQIPLAVEIPKGFSALTVPINLKSEAEIIRSMWETLQYAPVVARLDEAGHLVFYRKWIRRSHEEPTLGTIRAQGV